MTKTKIPYLVQPFPIVLVLARVRISHVGEALGAEGRNARKTNLGAARENGITDGEVAWVVDADDIPRISSLCGGEESRISQGEYQIPANVLKWLTSPSFSMLRRHRMYILTDEQTHE